MSERLFRGKTVDTNEWIEGALVRAIDCLDDDEKFFIIPEDAIYYHYGEFDVVKEVRRETVGQYIGLTDKDGKKIFEGDIVQIVYIDDQIYLVEWNDDEAAFKVANNYGARSFVLNLWGRDVEVIGNIHDNLELLKGGKERWLNI